MRISPKTISNFITDPKKIGPAVFFATGVFKTCKDYSKTRPERKKRIIAKDTAILAGSLAGFTVLSILTARLCKPNFTKVLHKIWKKLPEKALIRTEQVIKDSIQGTLNTFGGIVGALYVNEVMHKYVLNKPYFKPPKKDETPFNKAQSKVFEKFAPKDEVTERVLTTIADLPSMKVLEKPMVAMTSFSIANTKGYHNKFKKTSYELLANTLIPTIFVSVASIFVSNKKSLIKYPVLFAALSTGVFAGTKIANKYKDVIDDAIDGIDMKHIVVK